MLKKLIEYKDFEGITRKEEHYFHLSKNELIKWLTTEGDYTLDKVFVQITQKRNGAKTIQMFEDLIRRSYGRKSLDGRKFEKSEEIWNDFYQTGAYDELFMEVMTNAEAAAKFFVGLLPEDLAGEVDAILKDDNARNAALPDSLKDLVIEKNETDEDK